MAEALLLKAQRRQNTGTQSARHLRKLDLIPAIIYGHQQEPVAVQLNLHDTALELQHHHRLVNVELDGKQEKLLVKDVQYDHLGDKIIHVDLTRVSLDERVTVTVALELKGTPAGVAEGGVLEQTQASLELECPVTNIPETIRISIVDLKLGETLTAQNIELPPGVTLVTDANTVVAAVRVVAKEVVEEEAAPEEQGSEPKVISKEKPESETEKSSG